jgi:hypothetical protein
VFPHIHDLWDNRLFCPFNTKHIRQLFQVYRRSFSDGENGIAKPCHTQGTQLIVKELNAELGSDEGNVFDDGLSDSPLLVLREFHDGGKDGLR